MQMYINTVLERIALAIIGAGIGALLWLVFVFAIRWVLLFAFVLIGIDWVPAFFGWGIAIFAGIGALLGSIAD